MNKLMNKYRAGRQSQAAKGVAGLPAWRDLKDL
jgi:hypothetical protein